MRQPHPLGLGAAVPRGHAQGLRPPPLPEGGEDIIRAERESRQEVTLPTGSRVISLPANPDTVRGFSGNVYLDEFAFHRDGGEIWRAMYPAVARGYKVRITSTPNGMNNMFYDLWAGGGEGVSRHRTDIHEAAREGLAVDVGQLRRGIFDADSWAQEFECAFVDEAAAFITYEMIASCEDASCEDATKELDPTLPLPSDKGRMGWVNAELFLGVDVGRERDLTVFWLLEKSGDVYWTRMVKELDRAPFRVQRDFLYCLLDGSVFNPPHSPLNLGGLFADAASMRLASACSLPRKRRRDSARGWRPWPLPRRRRKTSP